MAFIVNNSHKYITNLVCYVHSKYIHLSVDNRPDFSYLLETNVFYYYTE